MLKISNKDTPLPNPPAIVVTAEQVATYQNFFADQEKIVLLMLECITHELQKEKDDQITFDMINHLKNMFQTQASQELYDTQRKLNMPHVLAVNTTLGSLTKLFDNFVVNYNMHGWDKSLRKLHEETGKGCHGATYGKWESAYVEAIGSCFLNVPSDMELNMRDLNIREDYVHGIVDHLQRLSESNSVNNEESQRETARVVNPNSSSVCNDQFGGTRQDYTPFVNVVSGMMGSHGIQKSKRDDRFDKTLVFGMSKLLMLITIC
ncbi:hypothetical protein Tco_0940268 [Tanacetum coccineum]|uniref:Uncharacterized protein n=1 Tax=Tanacetum coccineum TaxID=301880 RepID=A0ABQ5DNG3_9ASTR